MDELDLELDGEDGEDNEDNAGGVVVETKARPPCECGKCTWIDTKGEFPEYLEIELQPDGQPLADKLVPLANGIAQKLHVDMHWALEGQNITELPERLIASLRFLNIDMSKVTVLD